MTYNDALIKSGDAWKDLTNDEKTELLQALEDHVALESGRMACTVEGQFLYTGSDGIVMGQYDRQSGKILVNSSQYLPDSKYGKDATKLLETTLHEGRHAFQHQAVKGLIEHDVKETEQWRENIDNYIKYSENPRAYFEQPIEVDARNFASERLEQLNEERETLLSERNTNIDESKEEFVSQILSTSLPVNHSEEQASAFIESFGERNGTDLIEASEAFNDAFSGTVNTGTDSENIGATDDFTMSGDTSSDITIDDGDGMHI